MFKSVHGMAEATILDPGFGALNLGGTTDKHRPSGVGGLSVAQVAHLTPRHSIFSPVAMSKNDYINMMGIIRYFFQIGKPSVLAVQRVWN